ncbi:hypothetical protein CSUB_C0866 [Candidatus Caldarchaeum subterraneum]|uniref:Uncharacterized protein n=1 Tax=Caldiarchaeum subterraneum TaxID=311458 RepID=E6N6D0_CALS0|nr:hypothetical protein HGMM_F35E02C12 [Candidatus Caldarchaeum subterraneum]BAJ47930.1 hypothetical protein HGMM_F33G03C42 [Candidatus Caldarchaeum subterraneum]BAJ50723.1 hypothetical protein CSUB_C0866 [Candidatus Caldarchaeum subterraneum]
MSEENYLAAGVDKVRLKLVHVAKAEPEAQLERDELEKFPQLLESLRQARDRASAAVYPREFEALNPSPAVAVLSRDDAGKFVELIRRKTGASLYERAVKIAVEGDVFIVAVEYHCG